MGASREGVTLLEAAASARAHAIVSGDRHLLALGSWSGIPVQSPAAFLSEVPE